MRKAVGTVDSSNRQAGLMSQQMLGLDPSNLKEKEEVYFVRTKKKKKIEKGEKTFILELGKKNYYGKGIKKNGGAASSIMIPYRLLSTVVKKITHI